MVDAVKIVTQAAIKQHLFDMAGVDGNIPPDMEPTLGFVADPAGLARFMVCATMLLGAADATMLASVISEWTCEGESRLSLDETRVYTFPGWEVF